MSEHEERPLEGRSGYPEEEPPGVADGPQERSEDKPQRQGGRTSEGERPGAANEDEGTETGTSPGTPGAPGDQAEPGAGGPNPSPRREQGGL